MMIRITALATMLCFMLVSRGQSSVSSCSISPDVYHHGLYVDCHNRGLVEIPEDFPANTTSIDLSSNAIEYISNYSFTTTEQMQVLNLMYNRISKIESNAFTHCKILQTLNLMHNNMYYRGTVFDDLTNIQVLSIDGRYTGRVFKHLQELQHVTLVLDNMEPDFEGFHQLFKLRNITIYGATLLHNETFRNIADMDIEKLEIHCALTRLEFDTFKPLEHLKELSMRNIIIGVKKPLASLYGLAGRNMTTIEIAESMDNAGSKKPSSIEDRIIQNEDMIPLANICLKKLIIADNSILHIYTETFLKNTTASNCLTYIDVSRNALNNYLFRTIYSLRAVLPKLTYLDVSQQTSNRLPCLETYSSIYFNQSFWSMLQNISYFTTWLERGISVPLPLHLEVLNLSRVTDSWGMTEFSIDVRNGEHLRIFDVSFVGLYYSAALHGIDNLQYLDMSGNQDLQLAEDFFDWLPSLETLKLNYGSLSQSVLNLHGKQYFGSLQRLKSLSISSNRLVELTVNLFISNPNLQYLDISRNIFSSIPVDIVLLPLLHKLDMTSNALGTVDAASRTKIDTHFKTSNNSFELNLSGNFFSCSCDNFAFLSWLKRTDLYNSDNKNFSCLTTTGRFTYTNEIIMNGFSKFWRGCTGEITLYISLVLLSVLISSVILALLVLTNRTKLLNFFINILQYRIPKPKREDFRRDVYVSYAEADYQWVCHELCPALEERNLTLYIWDRDSVPGDSIPDQIVENIPQCWKIIIYFTDNYETDPWSYMGMMAAINCVDNLNPERLLLLLPEDAQARIPDCLLEVVPESCILHVAVGGRGNDQLWNDIRRMIRTDP